MFARPAPVQPSGACHLHLWHVGQIPLLDSPPEDEIAFPRCDTEHGAEAACPCFGSSDTEYDEWKDLWSPSSMEGLPAVAHQASIDDSVVEHPVDDTDDADQDSYQAGERGNEVGLGCPFCLHLFTWR